MKYSDIQELSYEQAQELARTEPALRVINFLSGRKGFDWWLEQLDADIQDEIFEELREVIK